MKDSVGFKSKHVLKKHKDVPQSLLNAVAQYGKDWMASKIQGQEERMVFLSRGFRDTRRKIQRSIDEKDWALLVKIRRIAKERNAKLIQAQGVENMKILEMRTKKSGPLQLKTAAQAALKKQIQADKTGLKHSLAGRGINVSKLHSMATKEFRKRLQIGVKGV